MTEPDRANEAPVHPDCSPPVDRGVQFFNDHLKRIGIDEPCVCHRCIRKNNIMVPGIPGFPLDAIVMILCQVCGNKRCPHASDHRLECTGSNEPGQVGSVYE